MLKTCQKPGCKFKGTLITGLCPVHYWQKVNKKHYNKEKKMLGELKKQLYREQEGRCIFCERYFDIDRIDLCHIVPRSQNAKLKDNKDNLFLSCREHHDIFDDRDFIKLPLPIVSMLLDRMQVLDESYYLRMSNK